MLHHFIFLIAPPHTDSLAARDAGGAAAAVKGQGLSVHAGADARPDPPRNDGRPRVAAAADADADADADAADAAGPNAAVDGAAICGRPPLKETS